MAQTFFRKGNNYYGASGVQGANQYQQVDTSVAQNAINNGSASQSPLPDNANITDSTGAQPPAPAPATAPSASTGTIDTSGITDPTIKSMAESINGMSSTITSDNSQNTDLYNKIYASQQSTQQQNEAALKSEEGAAIKSQGVANEAQTEGSAQTIAMLSRYHGVNTALSQYQSDLSAQQQAAIGNIKAQYDAAIASGNTAAAGQMQQTMLDQIHTNQQQDQQMFNNAMSLFSGMTSVINNQQQNAISGQQLDLSKQSLAFQEKQQTVTNATANLNTVLSSLAGNIDNTWGNLSADQQKQLSTLAGTAGIQPDVLKTMVNSNAKEGVNTTSVPGLLGTTILTTDKAGHVVSSSYVPMIDPNSPEGQSVIGSQVSWSNPSTPGGSGYISSSVLSSLKVSGIAAVSAASGAYPGAHVKILDTNDSNKMTAYSGGLASADQVIKILRNSGLPTDTNGVLLGSIGNNISSQLNGQINAFLAVNPGIVQTLMSAAGGMTSGFAIHAIMSSDGSSLITPSSDANTVEQGMKVMASIIAVQQNSIVPNFGTNQLSEYPDLTGSVTPITNGSMTSSAPTSTTNNGSTYNGITLPN